MACKHCGTNWKKDVTFGELKEELARRKAHAEQARNEYFARVYPTHRRNDLLMIANFFITMFVVGILAGPLFSHYIQPHVGIYLGPAALLFAALIFFVLCAPALYLLRKEQRTRADFGKEHPEHVEVLQGY